MSYRASVIIPAHNEERVLARGLGALLGGAEPGEFEVIVVANACTDLTAEIARRHGVRVIETDTPGKANALRLGDAAASCFPRLYADADVDLAASSARALVDTLARPGVLATAPVPRYDLTGVRPSARRVHKVHDLLMADRRGLAGAGVYGVNQAGHARVAPFPDAISDDGFVHRSFAPGERVVSAGASSLVRPAATFGASLRRRLRVRRGNRQLDALGLPLAEGRLGLGSLGGLLRSGRISPIDAGWYLALVAADRLRTGWQRMTRTEVSWGTDPSRRHLADSPTERPPARLSPVERLISVVLRALPVKHGKHRILDRVLPLPHGGTPRQVGVPFATTLLSINVGELVGWHFAVLRDFDPEVAEVLVSAADRTTEDVFWDIGANQGTCSYLVAAALPHARIVAIEPQHGLIEGLGSNLARLAAGRFEVHPVGLGSEPAVLQLTIPGGNNGAATLHAGERGVAGRREQVTITTAEELVHESAYGWPTLVKIDVEGHEAAVFDTLLPAIRDRRCRAIVFENHAGEDRTFATIHDIAESFGYRLYAITKTLFRTRLVSTDAPVAGVTDYALVHSGVATPALTRLLTPAEGDRR